MTTTAFTYSLWSTHIPMINHHRFLAIGSHPNQSKPPIKFLKMAIHVNPCYQANSTSINYKRTSSLKEVAFQTFRSCISNIQLRRSVGDKPSDSVHIKAGFNNIFIFSHFQLQTHIFIKKHTVVSSFNTQFHLYFPSFIFIFQVSTSSIHMHS